MADTIPNMTIDQISTTMNAISKIATGASANAIVDTSSFVSVANTVLRVGYDKVLNAISQVLTRTIFSIRPYSRKFPGLQVSNIAYGNHVRKLQIADSGFEDNAEFELVDGESIDMYNVHKPNILQTNFYDQKTFSKSITLFRDQLNSAFSSPDQFSSFVSMVLSNSQDVIEQGHEEIARLIVANMIGGKTIIDPNSCIHLLTEYNTLIEGELDANSVWLPTNFPAFIKWAAARIRELRDMLTERTIQWHVNITGKEISRHTPYRYQNVYIYSPMVYQIESNVLSSAFHDEYIRLGDGDRVNFWQSPLDKDTIKVTPSYMDTTGALVKGAATTVNNVFGIIADYEALGYTVVNNWSAATPFNARGGYSNIFYHFTDRYWNDFTENAIVLLLD